MTLRRTPGRPVRPLARRVLDCGAPRMPGAHGLFAMTADGWALPPAALPAALRRRALRVLRGLRRGSLTLARQDLRRLMRRPALRTLSAWDPPARFWRLPEALRAEATLLAWHGVTARLWRERGEGRRFAAAIRATDHPGYLGRPDVCAALAADLVQVGLDHIQAPDHRAEVARLSRLAVILGGQSPDHPPIGPWNSRAGIGEALVRACALHPAYAEGEDLSYVLSESGAAVANCLRRLLADASGKAEAEARVGRLLRFLADVIQGIDAVTHPGTTLETLA